MRSAGPTRVAAAPQPRSGDARGSPASDRYDGHALEVRLDSGQLGRRAENQRLEPVRQSRQTYS